MSTRRLLLLRHAKAEQGGPDHERALTPRGRSDAAAAGRWLEEVGVVPDLVLVSTAARTRQTWEAMAQATPVLAAVEVWPDRRLYQAHPADLLDVLQELTDDVGTVLLLGHSPGVPSLAGGLADLERSPRETVERLDEGFPTTACAMLETSEPWSGLSPESALLHSIVVPRASGAR